MLVTIFTTLLVLSLVLVFLGRFTDAPVGSITGYGFVFLLGSVLLVTGMTYESGYAQTDSYNYTLDVNNVSVVDDVVSVVSYEYDTVSGGVVRSFGFFLMVLGVLGFISVFANLGGETFKDVFKK